METLVINLKTENDKNLFYTLAKRLHLKSTVLTYEDKEDYGLLKTIIDGKTGEYVDTDNYINKLRKK